MKMNGGDGAFLFLESEFVQERELPSPAHAQERDGDEDFAGATVRVVGHDWFGQSVRWKTFDNVNINHPLSRELREYWNEHCTWYQIFGGAGPLDRLKARLDVLMQRRAVLLRQAPTDVVRSKLAKLERTKTFLEDELAFMEVGFITRPPSFSWHGQELKLEEPLSAVVSANTPQIEILVEPGRVGLGPGIVLLVSCVSRKRAVQADEFTAWLPCEYAAHPEAEQRIRAYGYPGQDYADITMKDLLGALQRIFERRRPEFTVQPEMSMLQYCGRRLEDEERAAEIFVHYEGEGLYSEQIEVVMELVPVATPPPIQTEDEQVATAVSATIAGLVQRVADAF